MFLLSRSEDGARWYGRSWKGNGGNSRTKKSTRGIGSEKELRVHRPKNKTKNKQPFHLEPSCSPPSMHPGWLLESVQSCLITLKGLRTADGFSLHCLTTENHRPDTFKYHFEASAKCQIEESGKLRSRKVYIFFLTFFCFQHRTQA